MKINRVTITGADEMTDWTELYALEKHYPFVEWGILFSKSKESTPRYPSKDKILDFCSHELKQLSAHFCGWYSSQIMEAQNFKLFDPYPEFSRFQINYNFDKSKNWQVKWIVDWAAYHLDKSIIFQSNYANTRGISLIESVLRSPNIHFLYDSSGGRGLETTQIHPPYKTYTGYSGGLHPGNIEPFLEKIYENKSPETVWIDMESGVRTENHFDPAKVGEVLSICQKFID